MQPEEIWSKETSDKKIWEATDIYDFILGTAVYLRQGANNYILLKMLTSLTQIYKNSYWSLLLHNLTPIHNDCKSSYLQKLYLNIFISLYLRL